MDTLAQLRRRAKLDNPEMDINWFSDRTGSICLGVDWDTATLFILDLDGPSGPQIETGTMSIFDTWTKGDE